MLYGVHDTARALKVRPHRGFAVEKYRSPWRRDYARLIHSPAFRRLQGKTQLFRGLESDFFRNRLTHSLEVAQIAKSIAIRINSRSAFFRRYPIETELVETAALAHDLGHPPFGHNGEEALDDCMKQYGGFEGKAQTLRILARLEKCELGAAGADLSSIDDLRKDSRLGLNLTYRTLAAILKYDEKIPENREENDKIVKGYYASEAKLVEQIKQQVLNGLTQKAPFKTIECSIMDISDDIAYSIYDLEDAFKAGFTSPLDLIASDKTLLESIANKVAEKSKTAFVARDVTRVLASIFQQLFDKPPTRLKPIALGAHYYKLSKRFTSNGFLRTHITSRLVTEFIQGVQVKVDRRCPALSKAILRPDVFEKVEVLKHFTYQKLIMSPMLKVAEHRGYEIVKTIFDALSENDGHLLLPDDFKLLYRKPADLPNRKRVICDFIAGMTDRYAVEFYARIKSENAETIFKPM